MLGVSELPWRVSAPFHLKKLAVIKCVINLVSFFPPMVYVERKWVVVRSGVKPKHTYTNPLGISQPSLTCQEEPIKDSLIFLYTACLQMTLELNIPFHLSDRNMIP